MKGSRPKNKHVIHEKMLSDRSCNLRIVNKASSPSNTTIGLPERHLFEMEQKLYRKKSRGDGFDFSFKLGSTLKESGSLK